MHRVVAALLGFVLLPLGAFVGGGLIACAINVCTSGMRTPEMFGWMGLFVIAGHITLLATAPALLAVLVFFIFRDTSHGTVALLSLVLSLALACITYITLMVMNPRDLAVSHLIIAGTVCLMAACIAMRVLRRQMTGPCNDSPRSINDDSKEHSDE